MTAAGVTALDGTRSYKQTIEGGFTFNVLNADTSPQLRVAASDYTITVADNYMQSNVPGMIDYLSIDFNNKTIPAPPPLSVNGLPYITTKTTLLRVPFSWDYLTFNGPDEPKLRSVLPSNDELLPFIGSVRSGTSATFDVSWVLPIAPMTGDYNSDGKFDKSDRTEWRKAFNKPSAGFADGNGDGVVDAADYVMWRKGQSSLGLGAANVPEPGTLALAAIVLLCIVSFRPERYSCCKLAQR